MALDLIIKPKIPPLSWRDFCRDSPRFSIALDGYVNAAPCFDPTGPRINFNHHEDVDRMATRSTCAQVLIAIRQGLFDLFRDRRGPRAKVYVDDCDEDICLSWYLLKNYLLVENACPESITRLVAMEDLVDATAGAYPLPVQLTTLQELAWIFEPYRRFRVSGGLDKKRARDYLAIITAIESRIERFVKGQGEHVNLDVAYQKIGGGRTWTMFKELGSHARTGAYNDGIRAYVSVRQVSPDRWVYTVGKMSPFVPFDLKRIIAALNKAEKSARDPWGGSTTVGGSPRAGASRLTPREVERIINHVL